MVPGNVAVEQELTLHTWVTAAAQPHRGSLEHLVRPQPCSSCPRVCPEEQAARCVTRHLHTLCAVSVSCRGEHRPLLRSAARAGAAGQAGACAEDPVPGGSVLPRTWPSVGSGGTRDKQPAGLRWFSLQGLSFWVCVIKTSVWVVDWGLRDSVVDKSD